MTSRTLTLLAAAALGVAGIAAGQAGQAGQTSQGTGQSSSAQPDRSTQTGSMSSDTAQPGMTTGSQGSMTSSQKIDDKEFVKQAASAGHYEVESSKLVVDKVKDPQIKQLAKTMESDHKQANDELKKIARQANIDVPSSPQGEERQMLSQLKQQDEMQLGSDYLRQQIQAHQKSIQLFQQAQTQVQDPQLKSFAQKQLPKLQEHLQHLEQMSSTAQPAGGAMQPKGMDQSPMDKSSQDNAPAMPKQ